jgi:hypothetical protein
LLKQGQLILVDPLDSDGEIGPRGEGQVHPDGGPKLEPGRLQRSGRVGRTNDPGTALRNPAERRNDACDGDSLPGVEDFHYLLTRQLLKLE